MQEDNLRKIAVFADVHALLEPVEAILEDIERKGIKEIYSLGDNIGVGPNPSEVIDLLEEYGVTSLAGNAEDYVNLGIEPFAYYFDYAKVQSQLWTLSKLNEHQKKVISLYPHSLDLLLGGKNIALCHFANDVRFDFIINSSWTYQDSVKVGPGYHQFLYTNSKEQLQDIKTALEMYGTDKPSMRGFVSAFNDPLFHGKSVDTYDAVIQGHIHWKIYESSESTDFYSIRAAGIAYGDNPINTASYVILTEKENGFDMEEVITPFDREKMEHSILNCDIPHDTIYKFVRLSKKL